MMESIRHKMNSEATKHIGRALLAVTGILGLAVGCYELSGEISKPEHATVRTSVIPGINELNSTWFNQFYDEKYASAALIVVSAGATILGAIGIAKSIDAYDDRKIEAQYAAENRESDLHEGIDWDSLLIDENTKQLTYKGITYDS